MNKFKEVKSLLDNKEVAQKYLGLPVKSNSTGNWYLSPFRNEKTASFCVSSKGIHDFGDSTHYDIISFVQKYFKTDNKTAIEILSRDFNLYLGNEYETNKTIKYLKEKKEAEIKAKKKVEDWYKNKFINICDKLKENEQCMNIASKYHNLEVIKILSEESNILEYEFELFMNIKQNDKVKLYLEYHK